MGWDDHIAAQDKIRACAVILSGETECSFLLPSARLSSFLNLFLFLFFFSDARRGARHQKFGDKIEKGGKKGVQHLVPHIIGQEPRTIILELDFPRSSVIMVHFGGLGKGVVHNTDSEHRSSRSASPYFDLIVVLVRC
jgi:hypothetical protein